MRTGASSTLSPVSSLWHHATIPSLLRRRRCCRPARSSAFSLQPDQTLCRCCPYIPLRCASLTTAPPGIFSDDATLNPAFHNANLVFLKYCTGDGWLGDAGAGAETFNYNFRGRAIINATVTALVSNHGMGSGARFLFGGCSAGGLGALASIDAVAALLDDHGLSSLSFAGFFDASGWVDIPSPSWLAGDASAPEPLTQTLQQLSTFINPAYPPGCADANQGQEYLCIYPSVRLPYVQTPFLLNAAQFDSFYFDYTLNGAVIVGEDQLQWAESYQDASLQLFNQLPPSASVFSTACEAHCLSLNTTFTALGVNGASLSDVLAFWFLDDAGGGEGKVRMPTPVGRDRLTLMDGRNGRIATRPGLA